MTQLIDIINIILDNKGIEKELDITPDTDFRIDLSFDSLDLAELTVRCEQAFGVDIFADGIVTSIREVLVKIDG